ncbi:Unknown protein sequence [Pseudomonas coronafaciens pv. oryzae]|nr:Unknown protein sequence [Pseudomonas coronafaciens pv. oryzae]
MLSDSRRRKGARIIHEKSGGPVSADQRRQRRAGGGEGPLVRSGSAVQQWVQFFQ